MSGGHAIHFDGLKAVHIDGVRHEIESVDIFNNGKATSISVQLEATMRDVTMILVFDPEAQT